MADSSRAKIIFTSIGGEEYIFNITFPFTITLYFLKDLLRSERKKLESYTFMQGLNSIDKYFSREITIKCTIRISFVILPKFNNITKTNFRYYSE